MRDYFKPVRTAIINIDVWPSAGEEAAKLVPIHTIGGNTKWYSCYGKQHGESSVIKNRATIRSINPSSGYLSKKN